MNVLQLIPLELRKLRRSGIGLILLTAMVVLWIPSVLNAEMNFGMQAEGISPEYSFLIQGYLAMAWFLYPAVMVVLTVLICQKERTDHGMVRMRTLPVRPVRLCLAKFLMLLVLSAAATLLSMGIYGCSAALASRMQKYDFSLPPGFVLQITAAFWISSLPMLTIFWLFAVWIRTPAFSVGAGLGSIVPSLLIANTRFWYLYPMAYPFYVVKARYGQVAENLDMPQVTLFPWVPAALGIFVLCLWAACSRFGREERSE